MNPFWLCAEIHAIHLITFTLSTWTAKGLRDVNLNLEESLDEASWQEEEAALLQLDSAGFHRVPDAPMALLPAHGGLALPPYLEDTNLSLNASLSRGLLGPPLKPAASFLVGPQRRARKLNGSRWHEGARLVSNASTGGRLLGPLTTTEPASLSWSRTQAKALNASLQDETQPPVVADTGGSTHCEGCCVEPCQGSALIALMKATLWPVKVQTDLRMKRRLLEPGNSGVVLGIVATVVVAALTAMVASYYLLSGCGSSPTRTDIKAQGRLSVERRASTDGSDFDHQTFAMASQQRQVSKGGDGTESWPCRLDITRAMPTPTPKLLPPAHSLDDSGPQKGKYLCPLLVVPKGTRLNCIVPDEVLADRQDTCFNVRGSNGADLFKMRISEKGKDCGVHVDTLDGEVQLAFLCTKDLFEIGSAGSSPQIFWPSEQRFGSLSKAAANEYRVAPLEGPALVFSGDFAECRIRVATTAGQTVAEVSQDTPDELRVLIHTLNDAGLIVLAVVGICKCERRAAAAAKERQARM